MTPSNSRFTSKSFLLLTAFIEGLSIMAVELLGAKLIEPYFGSSIYTWSSIFGITLVALAAGYYVGGVLSKKYQEVEVLYKALGMAAILIATMPYIGSFILEFTLFTDIRAGSLISSMLFIFPPIFCLGVTSPLIIAALSTDLQKTGKMAGTTYAVSTVGGIVAAILMGFFLIPMAGLRICTVIVAICAIFMPILFFLKTKRLKRALLFTSVIVLLSGFNIASFTRDFPKSMHFNVLHRSVLHRSDGINGQITVIDYLKTGARSLFVNNISQSLIYLRTGRSQFTYVHRIAAYASYKPEGSRVLVAGLGAGAMIHEFEILGFKVDVCDIDPRMEMIAKDYFGMTDKTKVINDDFRHLIKTTSTKYDIIALDISAGENQPNNLYTLEALADMKAILKEDGVLFVHYPSAYNTPMGLALKSIGRTLKKAGYTVDLLNTTRKFDMIQEYVYFASSDGTRLGDQDFSRRDTFALNFNFPIYKSVVFPGMKFDKGMVLTDDKPMMDLLHSDLATSYRIQMQPTIKSFLNEGIRFH